MLCEEKTFHAALSYWFRQLIKEVLDPALRQYCPQVGVDYRGYHFIQFEKHGPEDGRIWLDGRPISEQQLKQFLSMRIN